MSHFVGAGIFWIDLNCTDLGCWQLTLIAWLLSKLHTIDQTTEVQTEDDKYRLSVSRIKLYCKHCKTVVLVEKNLAAFLACHLGCLRGSITLFSVLEKNLTFYSRFHEKSMFLHLTDQFILTFSKCHLVNLNVQIHL